MKNHIVIDPLDEGGAGEEAEVSAEARNFFPGWGGAMRSNEIAIAAYRKCFSPNPGMGDRLFFKHLILKKLDDYFCQVGRYTFPHIARPLGSVSDQKEKEEAYLYEWVEGTDYFLREYPGEGTVKIHEWDEFVFYFSKAGIAVSQDVTDSENGKKSQNIVHQMWRYGRLKLNRCWKRIDFGDSSLYIDYDELSDFLRENSRYIQAILGAPRYDLMLLARDFLTKPKLTKKETEILATLAGNYRLSTLRHLKAKFVVN
ncbi:hypothetical protein A3G55_00040 [Candidatus Giovannonibacteria bacterium RIFCSPLOWO2_12_FULL_44_25]|uniref:Uncharacterized protein n=4 Tax=Candidatus Giovannoniibacteriota TaxID=1752738 RepID=A0A0G1LBL4_9BACT|nr:MAG: hypothetical protein UW15_C0013G0007 [Parcubacteria group bacterium GW2011_GWC1_44_10]KKT57319.1 MAG: hypothetical protein UW49_C0005G0007 [Candidatus Giovannonibacteria bacterium GW2011_GWB1_44_23]KKT59667.1 MAG: hypothetical protein UW53_C0009G0007 [Candidatus Giovannonibacteria bacterium GW2011_GWA1_44_25]KKT82740.1 MAG: hypothetical protein UW81_C0036G0001 [Candidatus Giovannonibacteria bacterium GW2011_GWC2_44_9]OGF50043.1 MAG: hypothetical protein A2120_02850 [Candidatus Giovannon